MKHLPNTCPVVHFNSEVMNYQPQKHEITFVLPVHFWKAEVVFQRISDSFARITVPIKCNQESRHTVSTEVLSRGVWRVLLSWTEGSSGYCSEETIEV